MYKYYIGTLENRGKCQAKTPFLITVNAYLLYNPTPLEISRNFFQKDLQSCQGK